MKKEGLNPGEDFLIMERDGERLFVHTEQMEETFYLERGRQKEILRQRNILDESNRRTGEYAVSSAAGIMFVSENSKPTADGLRALMKQKGLTGARAAEIVGVNSRTIRKWTGGERAIPEAAWRLLLLYRQVGET